MSYSESDRIAHLAHIARLQRELKIADWLKHNPEVGELNKPGEKVYYVTVKGKQVIVTPPADQSADREVGFHDALEISGFNDKDWENERLAAEIFLKWFTAGVSAEDCLVFASAAVVQYWKFDQA